MCHFIKDLRDEYATRSRNRQDPTKGPLYLEMDREHKAYHALEDREPSKFFEPAYDRRGRVKTNRDGTTRYDKTKYKAHIAEQDIPTMQRIEFLRNQWYQKWYRPDCVTCDGNCTNHSARGAYAHQAHVDARGRREEGKERVAAEAEKGRAAAAVSSFDARNNARKDVEAAIRDKNYEKATETLNKLRTICDELGGPGPGCQEDKLVALEEQIIQLDKKPAAAPASEEQSWASQVEEDSDYDDEDTGAGGGNKRKSKRRKRSMKKTHKRKSRKNKKR
jgi:hypothetical protein